MTSHLASAARWVRKGFPIPAYIATLLTALEAQIHKRTLPVDSTLSFEQFALLLPELNTRWQGDIELLEGLLEFARIARGTANAQAAAQVKSEFRT